MTVETFQGTNQAPSDAASHAESQQTVAVSGGIGRDGACSSWCMSLNTANAGETACATELPQQFAKEVQAFSLPKFLPRNLVAFVCLLLPASAWAQHLSFGVVGGVGLTDAFMNQTTGNSEAGFHTYSDTKDYLVGPSIEVRLPLNLAVEFDALYRPLHLTDAVYSFFNPHFDHTSQGTINTWEFPLLGKYHLPGHLIRPFLEAGPSFRHAGTNASLLGNISPLSNHGFTAGGGGEIHLWKIRIAPEVRYTRWAADTYPVPFSNVNQAELLVGLWF